MSAQNFIIADWGSTNVRMSLFTDGKLSDQKTSDQGITKVPGQQCREVFDALTAEWFSKYGPLPVTMAGMVGSVNGWVDAPYLRCPTDLNHLKDKLCPVPHPEGYDIKVIPGLCTYDEDNYNIMRGEETQIAGALKLAPSSIYVMPGTHSKWVYMEGTTVKSFRTCMTGELHAVLMKNTLVGFGTPAQEPDFEAFKAGLQKGRQADLLPSLFEVRGARVLQAIKASSASDYLSGLLIGNEASVMLKGLNACDLNLTIVANSTLSKRYKEAFDELGIKSSICDGAQALLEGILPIAKERS